MGKKATEFLRGKCKIHGDTDYYIYKDKPYKCAICVKEKSKEWRSKNKERVNDYNAEWKLKNPEKLERLKKNTNEAKKEKTKEKHKSFYIEFGSLISEISSKLSLKKIPPSIKGIKNPTRANIINFLIDSKKQEIFSHEKYRFSTYVKWKHLKSLNLKNATEDQKINIRGEYKNKAKQSAEEQMKKILENLK